MWLVTFALLARFAVDPPQPPPQPADRVSSERATELLVECWGAEDGPACVEKLRQQGS